MSVVARFILLLKSARVDASAGKQPRNKLAGARPLLSRAPAALERAESPLGAAQHSSCNNVHVSVRVAR